MTSPRHCYFHCIVCLALKAKLPLIATSMDSTWRRRFKSCTTVYSCPWRCNENHDCCCAGEILLFCYKRHRPLRTVRTIWLYYCVHSLPCVFLHAFLYRVIIVCWCCSIMWMRQLHLLWAWALSMYFTWSCIIEHISSCVARDWTMREPQSARCGGSASWEVRRLHWKWSLKLVFSGEFLKIVDITASKGVSEPSGCWKWDEQGDYQPYCLHCHLALCCAVYC